MSQDRAIPLIPHLIACSYESEDESKRVYEELTRTYCSNSSVMRIQVRGQRVIVIAADDEAAASYGARLPWGAGIPIALDGEISAAILERRKSGERLAKRSPGEQTNRRGLNAVIEAPGVSADVIQVEALNRTRERTESERIDNGSAGSSDAGTSPAGRDHAGSNRAGSNRARTSWWGVGGIVGATCSDFAQATEMRESIVSDFLDDLEGMIAVFGDEDAGTIIAICDTAATNAECARRIQDLAGKLDYRPSSNAAWGLWALRLRAGIASLPITFNGRTSDMERYLAGGGIGITPQATMHGPSRNQPCPCGSGKKFKRCCGA